MPIRKFIDVGHLSYKPAPAVRALRTPFARAIVPPPFPLLWRRPFRRGCLKFASTAWGRFGKPKFRWQGRLVFEMMSIGVTSNEATAVRRRRARWRTKRLDGRELSVDRVDTYKTLVWNSYNSKYMYVLRQSKINNAMSACTRQKAKSKRRDRMPLECVSQEQSNETLYMYRVKRFVQENESVRADRRWT